MDDFDPDAPLDTKAQYDAYVQWCSVEFERTLEAVEDVDRVPHAVTARAARLLFPAACAPIALDDDCDVSREQHLENLARLWTVAYKTEREHDDVGVRDWLMARGVVDCYEASGGLANNLLDAAKCAIGSIILTAAHPLVDLGNVHAPDGWALVLYGYDRLRAIYEEKSAEEVGPWDFAVVPNQGFIDKMNWQKLNNAATQMGAPPLSPN